MSAYSCDHGRPVDGPCAVCAGALWLCDHGCAELSCGRCKETTTYYGFDGDEELRHDSVDDVIVEWLEEAIFHPHDERLNEPMPMILRIERFRRMVPVAPYDAERLCEFIYEPLDELFAQPDGDPSDYSPEALIVAKALIDVVMKGYTSWMCETCGHIDVNVRVWLELNEPELLKRAKWQGPPPVGTVVEVHSPTSVDVKIGESS